MQTTGGGSGGVRSYDAATVPCPKSGIHGYTVRIASFHVDELGSSLPGFIT